jgi:hypothetical protein
MSVDCAKEEYINPSAVASIGPCGAIFLGRKSQAALVSLTPVPVKWD